MLSVDTNLVVRYLTADDAEQYAKSRAIIDAHDVFVCTTVVLETEWVLRRTYGYDGTSVARALRAFARLPRVSLEEPGRVNQAVEWMEAGFDFADALHLAASRHCDAFVSFDRRLARAANRVGALKVRAP